MNSQEIWDIENDPTLTEDQRNACYPGAHALHLLDLISRDAIDWEHLSPEEIADIQAHLKAYDRAFNNDEDQEEYDLGVDLYDRDVPRVYETSGVSVDLEDPANPFSVAEEDPYQPPF